MRLSTAFRADSGIYPPNGAIGRQRSQWYAVTRLKISSGSIEVADLGSVPAGSLQFRVPIGNYEIEAKLIDFAGSLCVSRVRARLSATKPTLGRKRGRVEVDSAAIAIGDFQSIRARLNGAQKEEFIARAREYLLIRACKKCTIKIGDRIIPFAICRAAEGDGAYPVFPLRSHGRCVGLEIEFFKDGYKLPPSPIPTVEFIRLRCHPQHLASPQRSIKHRARAGAVPR
jgi:hypothetical protein